MPKKPRRIPGYRLHKSSGQAVVRLDGRDIYLGRHASPESHAKYERTVGEWLAAGSVVQRGRPAESPGATLTVNELVLAYWKFDEARLVKSDEMTNIRSAAKPLVSAYGATPIGAFGPLKLRAVREQMIRGNLARTTINSRIRRLCLMFKWGVSLEMVPEGVSRALYSVPGLLRGEAHVRESAPIRPVPVEDVEKTILFLSRPAAGLVRFQLLTGCRPGEACMLRGCDVARSGATWTYRPPTHKNAHRGLDRQLVLGPKAQALLTEYAKLDMNAFIFGSDEAERLAVTAKRKARPKAASKGGGERGKPDSGRSRRYSVANYSHAVGRACRKAGVAHWHPNQFRHTVATQVRARFGLEAAQTVLGHSKANTTEMYAERDTSRAREVMGEVG